MVSHRRRLHCTVCEHPVDAVTGPWSWPACRRRTDVLDEPNRPPGAAPARSANGARFGLDCARTIVENRCRSGRRRTEGPPQERAFTGRPQGRLGDVLLSRGASLPPARSRQRGTRSPYTEVGARVAPVSTRVFPPPCALTIALPLRCGPWRSTFFSKKSGRNRRENRPAVHGYSLFMPSPPTYTPLHRRMGRCLISDRLVPLFRDEIPLFIANMRLHSAWSRGLGIDVLGVVARGLG